MGDFALPSKEDVQEAFEKRANGDETIDIDQFKDMCYMLYLTPTDRGIEELFKEIDVNNDEKLSLNEVYALIERQWTPFEERKKCFLHDLRKCRKNKGPMTRKELKYILQRGSDGDRLTDDEVDYCFDKLDLNGDRVITDDEIAECIYRSESHGHAREVEGLTELAEDDDNQEIQEENEDNQEESKEEQDENLEQDNEQSDNQEEQTNEDNENTEETEEQEGENENIEGDETTEQESENVNEQTNDDTQEQSEEKELEENTEQESENVNEQINDDTEEQSEQKEEEENTEQANQETQEPEPVPDPEVVEEPAPEPEQTEEGGDS